MAGTRISRGKWTATGNDVSDGPEDYSTTISGAYSALWGMLSGEEPLDYAKEKSFLALLEYAKEQLRLDQYFVFDADYSYTRLQSLVGDVVERYISTTNDTENLDRAKLLPIYLPIEKAMFADELPITAVVPILFLKFDFSQFQISESISVEKLTDEFHLARAWHGSWNESSDSLIESAATHGLFIRGLSLENENWVRAGRLEMDVNSYPVEDIDAFFAALRMATGYPAGYAQIVAVPVEWASSYAANMNPIEGPRVEKYPPLFRDRYWLQQIPTVTFDQAESIKQLFQGLHDVFVGKHARKVRLAMHRLNLSALRATDEDGIIDSMIAVEALLSDDAKEMTHKVALRLAALYKTFDPSRAAQVFSEMKRIYDCRSKIVHGAGYAADCKAIQREDGNVGVIDAALEHLRKAFAVLIMNPSLLEPKKIDDFLLTGGRQDAAIGS